MASNLIAMNREGGREGGREGEREREIKFVQSFSAGTKTFFEDVISRRKMLGKEPEEKEVEKRPIIIQHSGLSNLAAGVSQVSQRFL